MRNIRFIGDIHGYYPPYLDIIKGAEESIQVGDYGIGFTPNPIDKFDTSKHRFIRGNHDFPYGCTQEPNWIPDGTIEGNMMFVGGAFSVDYMGRTEGIDIWREEELSVDELYIMYDKYVMAKPRIMVAHEFPEHITNFFPLQKWASRSRTRDCFEAMFEKHKPEIWIGGHWHLNFDSVIDGCRFIVLHIDSYIDIDVENVVVHGNQTPLIDFG